MPYLEHVLTLDNWTLIKKKKLTIKKEFYYDLFIYFFYSHKETSKDTSVKFQRKWW